MKSRRHAVLVQLLELKGLGFESSGCLVFLTFQIKSETVTKAAEEEQESENEAAEALEVVRGVCYIHLLVLC